MAFPKWFPAKSFRFYSLPQRPKWIFGGCGRNRHNNFLANKLFGFRNTIIWAYVRGCLKAHRTSNKSKKPQAHANIDGWQRFRRAVGVTEDAARGKCCCSNIDMIILVELARHSMATRVCVWQLCCRHFCYFIQRKRQHFRNFAWRANSLQVAAF